MRRRLALLFLLIAVAAVTVALVRWRGGSAEVAALAEGRAAMETELDTTRASLHKASLRFQGFQKGMDSVPDSVRMFAGGVIMQQSGMYRKNIVTLEADERRLEIAIRKQDARIAAAADTRRRTTLPFAILAALLTATGAVLFAADRARRVAS